jgi:hypothetical protein
MFYSKQLDRLVYYIIAELFVFELELDNPPRKKNNCYSYIGYILCYYRASSFAFDILLERLTESSAKFFFQGCVFLGFIRDHVFLAKDRNFRKRVYFDITNKKDLVSLYFWEGSAESYNISGSLFSID